MNTKIVLFVIVPVLTIFFASRITRNFHRHPDLDDNITGIIRRHVGVHETHQIQTEDGYILTIFRIPRTTPKGVILFQHPIQHDARVWVSQHNESIAFLFWRAGYDVWLGNTRGNYFCKKHVTLKSSEREFWNFTFHEMGYYDNHAIVNYIRKNTNESGIVYLGHSLGTTNGLIYASLRREESMRFIKYMVLLAPVAHIRVAGSFALNAIPRIVLLRNFFNFPDLLSTVGGYDGWFFRGFRALYALLPCRTCMIYMCQLLGGESSETDPDLMDMLVQVYGSEFPVKLSEHFRQLYFNRTFPMYDFGSERNLEVYGTKKPPLYPIEKIKIPLLLVYGQNDSFADPRNFDYTYRHLPTNPKSGKMLVDGFSHMDFIYGRRRNEKLYAKILKILDTV